MEQNSTSANLFDLQIDNQSSGYLAQTAKWAKFLSIIGFIFCGFILLWGFFAGTIMSVFSSRLSTETGSPFGQAAAGIGTAFFLIIALICAVVYFFPCLYLFRFATKMQLALRNNDQNILTNSFGNLKSFYRFIGILAIIGLSFFLLEIIFIMIFAVTAGR
jgi:uncharacterized protein DUF5362